MAHGVLAARWRRTRRQLRVRLGRFMRRIQGQFRVQVPLVVVCVGLSAAAGITWNGVRQLREQSDAAAALRSTLLAQTLKERIQAAATLDRPLLLERAAERSGAELLLVDTNGSIVIDSTLGPPSQKGIEQLLVVGQGETVTHAGRTRFATAPLRPPLEHLALLSFVPVEAHPYGESSMVRLTLLFAAILVTIAAGAAYGLARSVQTDIAYIKNRIVGMARPGADPAGETIPVRTADAVGLMTNAFNEMVERFTQYEFSYRHDLDKAIAYDRERSEFLAAISHELRTPLNVILGFTDVLLSGVDGPLSSDAVENLTVVRRSGAHLQQLINDVLDLSAIESGVLQLDASDTDIFAIAAAVVQETRVSALEKGLLISLEGESATAWADPVRVRQIIGNLLGNAVKFTSTGFVAVRVSANEEGVQLSVKDTGPGIAPAESARIFEEFQQVGSVRARRSGTGLGLAITRRLLKMHGGTIRLDSTVGVGSEFIVQFPRHAPPPSSPPSSQRLAAATIPPTAEQGP
jgi:signal transduction histidine kinase